MMTDFAAAGHSMPWELNHDSQRASLGGLWGAWQSLFPLVIQRSELDFATVANTGEFGSRICVLRIKLHFPECILKRILGSVAESGRDLQRKGSGLNVKGWNFRVSADS